ncbi:hypothetical protein QJQ45_023353, partial [Haematococcus lacustris]
RSRGKLHKLHATTFTDTATSAYATTANARRHISRAPWLGFGNFVDNMSESVSSFGSGVSGVDNVEPDSNDAQEVQEPVLGGLFGVLFVNCVKGKTHASYLQHDVEKAPSRPFVIFRLFLDWLQLFLLIVNPAYGWTIDPGNKVWQAFSFLSLNYFMSARGYTFFLACMYILAVCLFANLALCIWVSHSFQQNKFDHVWPIAWLRVFSLIFFQVLDIASVTLFLIALDCQYFAVPDSQLHYNQEFPDVYCWGMPHIIHASVAAIAVGLFVVLATIFTAAEVELNPVSRNLLGMPHSRVEVLGFCIKMLMTAASVFVNGLTWLSVIFLVGSFFLVYLYLKWLPHLHATINHIRVATYASILYVALLFIILAYAPGVDQNNPKEVSDFSSIMTTLLWAGFVPVGLAGAIASYLHTQYWTVTVVGKFRDADPEAKLKKIHPFTDPRQVEIASRCCRHWVDEDTLEPDGVVLAERIISAGKLLMPHQPYMVIWYSSFLIDVQGSYQSGYAELQYAKKAPNPSLLERFCIFVRDQEHAQKSSAASSGDNASVDLVSYVEFQRNYRLAVKLHTDALLAKRTFWETLLHANVTFDKLSNAVARIESTVRASDRMYKQLLVPVRQCDALRTALLQHVCVWHCPQVLSRHSNSVKVLQLYVKFLQGVRSDPWSAARWAAEAEKLQKLEEEANERAVFGGGPQGNSLHNHDDSKGVIIMGANCLVRMINDVACGILGYTNKQEILGKNINVIVPPPFSRNHNNYVRNYIQTGKAKILDQLREFVALHKDRYVKPISVFVTKVSGIGEDSVFMGVFAEIVSPHNVAIVWVMGGGQVLSCDGTFTDWLGYKQEDLHGKPVTDLVLQRQELEQTLMQMKAQAANAARTKGAVQSVWQMQNLQMRHFYLDEVVQVDAEIKVGGINETALYVLTMRRSTDASQKLMVTDSRGRILHVTKHLATDLNTTVSKLQGGGAAHALDALLPQPFMRIHHQWYQDRPEEIPPWSCRSGLSIYLPSSTAQGAMPRPYSLGFTRREVPGKDALNVVTMTDRTEQQVLDERRLSLVLNSKGLVLQAGDSTSSLFGFEPTALVGAHLAYVVDVLRPSAGDGTGIVSMLDDELRAGQVLMHMAERSYANPGASWRVGVSPIMDPVQLAALGPMGMAMMAKKTVPAVMTVEAHLEQPFLNGARVQLPPELLLKVELWRADLLSGVIELDTQGNVVQLGIKDQPIFSPHLLLGVPTSMLQGAAIASILPVPRGNELGAGKAHLEALFTEGSMGKAAAKPGAGRPGRGGIARGGFTRRRAVGPLHHIKLPHGTDGAELELQVQAVVKQDVGTGCSLYLMLHVEQARMGRDDFATWIWGSPNPSLLVKKATHRRSSMVSTEGGGSLYASASYRNSMPKDATNAMQSGHMPGVGFGIGPSRLSKDHARTDLHASFMPTGPHSSKPSRLYQSGLPEHLEASGSRAAAGPPAWDIKSAVAKALTDADAFPLATYPDEPGTPPDPAGTDGTHIVSRQATKELEEMPSSQEAQKVANETEVEQLQPWELPEQHSSSRPSSALNKHLSATQPVAPEVATGNPGPRGLRNQKSAKQSMKKRVDDAGDTREIRKLDSAKKRGNQIVPTPAPKEADSDAESDQGGLKLGGKQRINDWMTSVTQPGAGSEPSSSSDYSDEETAHDEDDAKDQEEQEEGSEAAELDEASTSVNDFKRGKRLKRMAKTLTGPQAMGSVFKLKAVAWGMVAMLLVVDLAMFVMFLTLAKKQAAQVTDLQNSGLAIHRVLQLAIAVSSLQVLYPGVAPPTLRHMGSAVAEDIVYQLDVLGKRTSQLDSLHRGIYRGFNEQRRLTANYGIRDIWEQPLLNLSYFFDMGSYINGDLEAVGLWDAGNTYILQARDIMQNSMALYGANTSAGRAFTRDPNVMAVLYDGPHQMVPAYIKTLDGLMLQAIADSKKVNDVQLIILAVEGVVISCTAILVMWILSSKVVFRRYTIYSVFMLVPHGLIRSLATKSIELEEGAQEEDAEGGVEDDGVGTAQPGATSGNDLGADEEGGRNNKPGWRAGGGVRMALASRQGVSGKAHHGAQHVPTHAGQADVLAPTTTCQATTSCRARWPDTPLAAISHRCLVDSVSAQVTQVIELLSSMYSSSDHDAYCILVVAFCRWPFIAWAMFLILVAAIGYTQLSAVTSPIAVGNIGQFVKFRAKMVMYYSQRLVSGPYIYSSHGPNNATLYPLGGPSSSDKAHYRLALSEHYDALRKEYDALLYGKDAPLVINDTSDHFQLATQGIQGHASDQGLACTGIMCRMFSQGSKTLYGMTGCMAEDLDDCQPPTSPYYACGNADVTGGLVLLSNEYDAYVQRVYQEAVTLHIITFVMCWVVCLGFQLFIMRPYSTRIIVESKRIAELLSNLPTELDVEALVSGALQTQAGSDPQATMAAAVAAKEDAALAAREAGSKSQRALRRAVQDALPSWPADAWREVASATCPREKLKELLQRADISEHVSDLAPHDSNAAEATATAATEVPPTLSASAMAMSLPAMLARPAEAAEAAEAALPTTSMALLTSPRATPDASACTSTAAHNSSLEVADSMEHGSQLNDTEEHEETSFFCTTQHEGELVVMSNMEEVVEDYSLEEWSRLLNPGTSLAKYTKAKRWEALQQLVAPPLRSTAHSQWQSQQRGAAVEALAEDTHSWAEQVYGSLVQIARQRLNPDEQQRADIDIDIEGDRAEGQQGELTNQGAALPHGTEAGSGLAVGAGVSVAGAGRVPEPALGSVEVMREVRPFPAPVPAAAAAAAAAGTTATTAALVAASEPGFDVDPAAGPGGCHTAKHGLVANTAHRPSQAAAAARL